MTTFKDSLIEAAQSAAGVGTTAAAVPGESVPTADADLNAEGQNGQDDEGGEEETAEMDQPVAPQDVE